MSGRWHSTLVTELQLVIVAPGMCIKYKMMCSFHAECVTIVANVRFFLIVATIVTHLRQKPYIIFYSLMHAPYGLMISLHACRLYDTDATMQLVKKWVGFYKTYRDILISDIVHVRRPDMQGVCMMGAREWK